MVSSMLYSKWFTRPCIFIQDLKLVKKQLLTSITLVPLLNTCARHFYGSQISQMDNPAIAFFFLQQLHSQLLSMAVKASNQGESFQVSCSLISPTSMRTKMCHLFSNMDLPSRFLDNHEQQKQSALDSSVYFVLMNICKITLKYLKFMSLFLINTFSDLKTLQHSYYMMSTVIKNLFQYYLSLNVIVIQLSISLYFLCWVMVAYPINSSIGEAETGKSQ